MNEYAQPAPEQQNWKLTLAYDGTEFSGWQVQPGDTSPPRAEAQMPAHALESRRVLQFRKKLADKRENHVL